MNIKEDVSLCLFKTDDKYYTLQDIVYENIEYELIIVYSTVMRCFIIDVYNEKYTKLTAYKSFYGDLNEPTLKEYCKKFKTYINKEKRIYKIKKLMET